MDPTDARAAAAGLPPIDSLDMSALLFGTNATSPRTEVAIGSSDGADNAGNTIVQGIIDVPSGLKLVIGDIDPAFFQGPTYPNTTSTVKPPHLVCGDPDAGGKAYGPGCLFDVLNDPSETTDLAGEKKHAADVTRLRKRIAELQKGVFNPDRGSNDPDFCKTALGKWGGFVGPFLD